MDESLKREIVELINGFQFQDSIELGNAGGRIKVYVNFDDGAAAGEKIGNAIAVLKAKRLEVLE